MSSHSSPLERLLAEEPFVRALARCLLAGEADDLVQEAWLRAIGGPPPEPGRSLRGWLARIVRNLVVDRQRRKQRLSAREAQAVRPLEVPSSDELLAGEELRRALVRAVDALPEEQRTVVLLRYYEGLPPRHIAARLGLPVPVVWRRLHAAIEGLRSRLDALSDGDRRAWLLSLVPFASAPRSLPWRKALTPGTSAGVIAMTMKAKFVAAAAVVLALTAVWLGWPGNGGPASAPPTGSGTAAPMARAVQPESAAPAGHAPVAEPEREVADVLPSAAAPTTGTLLVHVRYADGPPTPSGLELTVSPPGVDLRRTPRRARTDAKGTARFEDLAPGRVYVFAEVRADVAVAADIVAGETRECDFLLTGGLTLSGIVVDTSGVPIGGALIEAAVPATSQIDARTIAVTAADGTFEVRQSTRLLALCARAEGHAASTLQLVNNHQTDSEQVRFTLSPDGGAVEGQVLDANGPVAGVTVRVGEGRTESVQVISQSGPPLPAQVRTDSEGRFRAIGIAAGRQPIMARDPEHAPWRDSCEVTAGATTVVRIVLTEGVSCQGTVRTEAGEPTAASILVGKVGDFDLVRAYASEDGAFLLTGLPAHEVEVTARQDLLGKASARIAGRPGETVHCELMLSNGLAIVGRVVDEEGEAVSNAQVHCETEGVEQGRPSTVWVDDDGRFVLADREPGRRFTVFASDNDGRASERRTGIVPGGEPLELVLAADTRAPARIFGRLLWPDGSAAIGEEVGVFRTEPQQVHWAKIEDEDAHFSAEVVPGPWWIRVTVDDHPVIVIPTRELQPGESWDLGDLRLSVGGRLIVEDDGERTHYLIFDDEDAFVGGVWAAEPPLHSELLAPGDYILLAHATDRAGRAFPFTIESESDTTLAVELEPGVCQRVQFDSPKGAEPPTYVSFDVRQDGKLVLLDSATGLDGAPPSQPIWLAPGDYELRTREREPEMRATFTVGAEEGPVLHIPLR